MSFDEIARAISYCVIIPGAAYVGVRVWNAIVMPESLRRPVALFLWLQASIYTLFMVGLFLLRLWHPMPNLLLLNTGLIVAQALIVLYVIGRIWRLHQAMVAIVALAAVLFLAGG